MGFLDREAKVMSLVGRAVGHGLLAGGRLALGGTLRRRATLVLVTLVGGAGYIWLEWGVRRLLTTLLGLVFGIPAPGQPLAFSTWATPQNGFWPEVLALSWVSMAVAGAALLAQFGRAMSVGGIDRRRALKRVGRAAVLVATTWTLLPFGLHLADQLATVLAPTPAQLRASWPSTGSGIGVLAVVAIVQPLVVALAVLAMALLRAIILLGFVAWPLAWPLRTLDHDLANGLGRSITALFTVAVVTKLLQALLAFGMLRFTGATDSLALRTVVFVVGMVGVFVVFPLKMLQYADRVMLLPGALAPSEQQLGRYVDESSKRVGQVHRTVNAGLDRAREWRAPDPSREAVQTRVTDWAEATNESSSWWSGWLQREWVPRHTSAEWHRSATRTSMDGAFGPTSEDPDEPVAGCQDRTPPREQGRHDEH